MPDEKTPLELANEAVPTASVLQSDYVAPGGYRLGRNYRSDGKDWTVASITQYNNLVALARALVAECGELRDEARQLRGAHVLLQERVERLEREREEARPARGIRVRHEMEEK
jgi:hypothetical protein